MQVKNINGKNNVNNFKFEYDHTFLNIDINSEDSFSKLQSLIYINNIQSMLPIEYQVSTQGIQLLNALLEYLNIEGTIEDIERLLKNELRKFGVKSPSKDKHHFSKGSFNFTNSKEATKDLDDSLVGDNLSSVFTQENEKYTFYKLMLLAALGEKSLSIDKVEYLLKIRHNLELNETVCSKILYIIAQASGDPSFRAVKGIDHVNFVFATALKSILIDHNTINPQETKFVSELWNLLSKEGDRKNYLTHFLDKSELPENRRFHFKIESSDLPHVVDFYSILLSKVNIDEKIFRDILDDLVSYNLDVVDITKAISQISTSPKKDLREVFKKISIKNQFFVFIEGLHLLLKTTHSPILPIDELQKIALEIKSECIFDSEACYLMLCEFVLLHRNQVSELKKIFEHIVSTVTVTNIELQRFHLFSIVYNLLKLKSESFNLTQNEFINIFEMLEIDTSSMSIKKDIIESEEIRLSVLRLLLLSDINFLIKGNIPELNIFSHLVDKLYSKTFSTELSEYIIRIIAKAFVIGGSENFKRQMEKSDRLYKVVVMDKNHSNFFNKVIDNFRTPDDVIRRILYIVAIETGVIMLFNEKIDYSKFKIKK